MPSLEPQFGCRPGRPTMHALIAIQHKWMQTLDNKGSVRPLFVDFKKVFDIVNHNILFSKLKNFNISHSLLKWFASYLFHRRQHVRVGSQVSSWIGLPRVPGYPTGTQVPDGYPGNKLPGYFLLPAATRVPKQKQITANVLNISTIFNRIYGMRISINRILTNHQ